MADNDKLVATLKAGKDFNAPWLVIHAESPTEMNALLDYISGDLLAKINSVSQQFQGFANAAPLAPTPGVTQQAAPPAPVPHPVDNAPAPAPQAPQAPAQQQQGGSPQAPGVNYPDGSFKGEGWTANTDPEGKVSGCCNLPLHWRKFTSKAGKPIKGYFCPGPGFDHDKPDFR